MIGKLKKIARHFVSRIDIKTCLFFDLVLRGMTRVAKRVLLLPIEMLLIIYGSVPNFSLHFFQGRQDQFCRFLTKV